MLQNGVTGHIEYTWSDDIREKIFQFQFQLTRTHDMKTIQYLERVAQDILIILCLHEEIALEYMILFYKIIGHTRDIVDGKGEYLLTYMLICVWYEFYPELAFFALDCLVDMEESQPYGSWKDIKYFCNYAVFVRMFPENHPLILHCIRMVNGQLKKDMVGLNKPISLVAKWIPREKSNKFGWLFHHLANDFFIYTKTASPKNMGKAILKSNTDYRKIISALNAKLNTLEIKQCNKEWDKINFQQVTSIALIKQANAFLNIKSNGESKESPEMRKECADRFKMYIQCKTDEVNIRRIGTLDIIKQAIELMKIPINENIQIKIDMLNIIWKQSTALMMPCNVIPLLDVSSYTSDLDSYYAGLDIALKMAEVSNVGKRIMIFGGITKMISLEDCSNFMDMIKKVSIELDCKGLNANLYSSLDFLADSITESKIPREDLRGLIVVILSNMEIDLLEIGNKESLYGNICRKFKEGMPRFLLWNLKSTKGFPCHSLFPNVSMTAGYNPLFLNLFNPEGFYREGSKTEEYTPWTFFVKSLKNKRYAILERKITNFFKKNEIYCDL